MASPPGLRSPGRAPGRVTVTGFVVVPPAGRVVGLVTVPAEGRVAEDDDELPDGLLTVVLGFLVGVEPDDGLETEPDGLVTVPDGRTVVPEGRVTVPDGRTVVPEGRVTVPDERDTVPCERVPALEEDGVLVVVDPEDLDEDVFEEDD